MPTSSRIKLNGFSEAKMRAALRAARISGDDTPLVLILEPEIGFEPMACSLQVSCSDQLSYPGEVCISRLYRISGISGRVALICPLNSESVRTKGRALSCGVYAFVLLARRYRTRRVRSRSRMRMLVSER